MPDELEVTGQEDALIGVETIVEQVDTLLVYLERPIVQAQVGALLVVFILMFFLAQRLRRWTRRFVMRAIEGRSDTFKGNIIERWLPAISHLYFPIAALILVQLALAFFNWQQMPSGIISTSLVLIGIFFGYAAILTVLFILFKEQKVRPYEDRILTPLFVLIILSIIVDNLLNLELLAALVLFRVFDTNILLGNVVAAIILLYVFINISWLIQGLLRDTIIDRTQADPAAVNSVVTVGRFAVMSLGILLTLATLGFNLTTLAVIGGGLSVGIGLGLQNIVSNFFSGIVLLFEGSLRPGDIVEFEGNMGVVQDLSIRSTTVRTWDNIEVIIPNERFFSSSVTTYTKTNTRFRVHFPIGVSYGSSADHVRSVLLDIANASHLVLEDPAPAAWFLSMGDSSLNFSLYVWVDHVAKTFPVKDEIYSAVLNRFREEGIEIPFPQRDLHIRTGLAPFVSQPIVEAEHEIRQLATEQQPAQE